MYLARKINKKDEWLRLLESDGEIGDPSFEIANDFLDRSLSVYELSSEGEALRLAAALSLINSTGPCSCLIVLVPRKVVEDSGLTIKKNKGSTFLPAFDDRHFEIKVASLGKLRKVIDIWLAGTPISFEKKEVIEQAQVMLERGEYDFSVCLKRNDSELMQGLSKMLQTGSLFVKKMPAGSDIVASG